MDYLDEQVLELKRQQKRKVPGPGNRLLHP